jgi:hypothetical protein
MAIQIPSVRYSDREQWEKSVVDTFIALANGRSNNTGTLTLTASSATTVVNVAAGRLGNDTIVLLMPTTANAGTEYGSGNVYITTDVANKQFTITHTNNAQTDRTFKYVLIG